MDKKLGIEVDTIRTIINEMHFMVEHEYTISHKDKNRYIAIIEALEKQIPKKPKEIRYFRICNYYAGLCPICNGGANSEFQYCGDCGQRLDWSVEDENKR